MSTSLDGWEAILARVPEHNRDTGECECACCRTHGRPRMFHSAKGECKECGFNKVCVDRQRQTQSGVAR